MLVPLNTLVHAVQCVQCVLRVVPGKGRGTVKAARETKSCPPQSRYRTSGPTPIAHRPLRPRETRWQPLGQAAQVAAAIGGRDAGWPSRIVALL